MGPWKAGKDLQQPLGPFPRADSCSFQELTDFLFLWIWGKDGGYCWIEKGVFSQYNCQHQPWLQKCRPGSFVVEHMCCRASLSKDLTLCFELLKAGQPGVTPGSHGAMLLA